MRVHWTRLRQKRINHLLNIPTNAQYHFWIWLFTAILILIVSTTNTHTHTTFNKHSDTKYHKKFFHDKWFISELQNTFTLVQSDGNNIILCASNAKEKDEWVTTMETVVKQLLDKEFSRMLFYLWFVASLCGFWGLTLWYSGKEKFKKPDGQTNTFTTPTNVNRNSWIVSCVKTVWISFHKWVWIQRGSGRVESLIFQKWFDVKMLICTMKSVRLREESKLITRLLSTVVNFCPKIVLYLNSLISPTSHFQTAGIFQKLPWML